MKRKRVKKRVFIIPCSWEMYGKLYITAKSVEEAIAIAESPEQGLPGDNSYVDGSFQIDDSVLETYNHPTRRKNG